MSASSPGPVRRFFRGVWRVVDVSRRVVLNLIFLLILAFVVLGLIRSGPGPIAEKTALVLALDGSIAEQKTGDFRATALDQVRGGETPKKLQLRDVVDVIDTAATDEKISSIVLLLDDLRPSGFTTLREVGAALKRFRAAGKKVVAWGSSYDQRQYYLAAHADEVLLHPRGAVHISGFGGLRNYYRDLFDTVGVSVAVVRAGTFKDFGEPYVANGPSPETVEADRALYGSLWQTWTDTVEAERKLPAGAVARGIDELPARLTAAGGDTARLALGEKLVDALRTRDELRRMLVERGAADEGEKTFRQVSYDGYLARLRPALTGDAIGVVVAEGEIVDGTAPAGTIGGLSTANLVRLARENADVKALVLRVNSPGGSVFGSELVRRELELTRAAGKPVVVSMGDLAASGGYMISIASDEIVADQATVTGSIGVIALLPNFSGTLQRVGVHPAGVATTWLRGAEDPRVPLDPRLRQMIQSSVDFSYADFTGKVAVARKTTPAAIDAVAQGRVWTGVQARERGLVDRLGLFGDAVKSAAARAGLVGAPRLIWIERDPGAFARLVGMLNAQVAGLVGEGLDARLGGLDLLGGLGRTPRLARDAARELGWLADVAERRKPFGAVAHCLCGSTF